MHSDGYVRTCIYF